MITRILKLREIGIGAIVTTAIVGFGLVASTSVIANGVMHSVHVGGPDICSGIGQRPGCDANFSLTANEFSDGQVNGRWTDVFAHTPGDDPVTIVVAIDCLHVNGNDAWVAGEIVGPDFTGFRVATQVQDNGVSKRDFPDRTSFTRGVGNAFDCHAEPEFLLFDYVEGQVIVR